MVLLESVPSVEPAPLLAIVALLDALAKATRAFDAGDDGAKFVLRLTSCILLLHEFP